MLRRWASEHMKKKLTGTGGPALVSAYNVMTQVCTTGQNSTCMHAPPRMQTRLTGAAGH